MQAQHLSENQASPRICRKAAAIHCYGDLRFFQNKKTSLLQHKLEQILVRFRATSVDPIERKMCRGMLKAKFNP